MLVIEEEHFTLAYLSAAQSFVKMQPAERDSRLGPVRDLGPAVFRLGSGNRLAILPAREINPWFALAEASWILCGRQDLAPLQAHISRIRDYSDDGDTLNGAYGFRMRTKYGLDQLGAAIALLRRDPTSRRAVVQLWGVEDLSSSSKDLPCNTAFYLKIRDERLCMSVTNRSNDLYLGLPYDVFVLSVVQNYVASALGLTVGEYVHFSDSLHVYARNERSVLRMAAMTSPERLARALTDVERFDISAFSRIDHAKYLSDPAQMPSESNSLCALTRTQSLLQANRTHEALQELPPDDGGVAAIAWIRRKRQPSRSWLPQWYSELETRLHHVNNA